MNKVSKWTLKNAPPEDVWQTAIDGAISAIDGYFEKIDEYYIPVYSTRIFIRLSPKFGYKFIKFLEKKNIGRWAPGPKERNYEIFYTEIIPKDHKYHKIRDANAALEAVAVVERIIYSACEEA